MYGAHIRASARVNKRQRDGHLAAQSDIVCLEFHHLDHLLVWHELHETAAVRVRVRGRFAGPVGST
jgi:hypothetical protein